MSIAVVGNGAIALDAAGRCFVNRHTADFLAGLARLARRTDFIEPALPTGSDVDLTDAPLPAPAVRALPISKTSAADLCRAAVALLRADWVYIFYPGTLPRAVARLCRAIGKPYALYLRGERFDAAGPDAAALRNARFVCCVGGMADRVRGLNPEVVPIRPMFELGRDDIHRRDIATRAPGPWRLLFVGRLDVEKGIPELVEAAEMLRARGFAFSLTLVGSGPLLDELRERCARDRETPIRILGVIDNKAALNAEYERADILVLPTHHEGFPRVLYEAMVKSTLVVTTFVGGIPGVMRAGFDCIEIPRENAAAIAAAIEAVTADVPRMQALVDNAHDTVVAALERHPSHLEAVAQRIHG